VHSGLSYRKRINIVVVDNNAINKKSIRHIRRASSHVRLVREELPKITEMNSKGIRLNLRSTLAHTPTFSKNKSEAKIKMFLLAHK